ncbi:hypothetical protein M404DRAFT_997965 [Pisolithus tinctorius Marx 270]|uniref:Zn(2)-C6 fungal-type domain-containing protein n=1 Tax=Pisolithus tinctorius Marx 270 TaxID=870435 RepID=A0A0C3PID4_PISTI|nr:hypothetical protein M404DRAFT_997965 [Pisolithus tinctorius Marx 270]
MASPQFQEPVWVAADSFHGDLDSALWLSQGAGSASYDHYPEHLWKSWQSWQDPSDNMLPWVDTSDGGFDCPPYHPLLLSFDSPTLPTEHSSPQRSDSESSLRSIPLSLTPSLAYHGKGGNMHLTDTTSHDYKSALVNDCYLTQVPSLASDAHCTVTSIASLPPLHCQPDTERRARAPSKKRSIEEVDGFNVKEENDAHSSLSTTNDAYCLPQLHMTVPSQGAPLKVSYTGSRPSVQQRTSHSRERDSYLSRQEDTPTASRHFSNKRFHHSTDGLIRQEAGIRTLHTANATWSNPDDPLSKSTKKSGEQKKQALACLFCRERKIACGRPSAHNPDQTCNQCARRRIKCEYPTESRRGQHKRRRKTLDSDVAGQTSTQSPTRTNPAPPSTPSTSTTTSSPSSNISPPASA